MHGGDRFRTAVRLDDDTLAALRELTLLAPLHQPKSLAAIEAVSAAFPDVPAVACFDTAFHATLPAAASTYALPRAWRERYGVRRFGFHGLSHAYASRQAAGARRVVTCHLGAGASLCAVLDGRSVDTTMGFTPLEGLVMATRSGSVDPGLLLWLQQHEGLSVDQMADALEHSSGLLGLAGTADMRTVVERSDDDARLAFDVYVHRLRAGIGAMAASLGGLDALVFTGGVGERSAEVREAACDGLALPGRDDRPGAERRAVPGRGRDGGGRGRARPGRPRARGPGDRRADAGGARCPRGLIPATRPASRRAPGAARRAAPAPRPRGLRRRRPSAGTPRADRPEP